MEKIPSPALLAALLPCGDERCCKRAASSRALISAATAESFNNLLWGADSAGGGGGGGSGGGGGAAVEVVSAGEAIFKCSPRNTSCKQVSKLAQVSSCTSRAERACLRVSLFFNLTTQRL